MIENSKAFPPAERWIPGFLEGCFGFEDSFLTFELDSRSSAHSKGIEELLVRLGDVI